MQYLERETERERQRERDRERETERETERERDRESQRGTEKGRERQREKERDRKDRESKRGTERGRESQREKERQRETERCLDLSDLNALRSLLSTSLPLSKPVLFPSFHKNFFFLICAFVFMSLQSKILLQITKSAFF